MERVEYLDEYNTNNVNNIRELLNRMLNRMREIDSRGSFEADDEVGSTFTELKDTIEFYNSVMTNDIE
jgi:hypothetical protein